MERLVSLSCFFLLRGEKLESYSNHTLWGVGGERGEAGKKKKLCLSFLFACGEKSQSAGVLSTGVFFFVVSFVVFFFSLSHCLCLSLTVSVSLSLSYSPKEEQEEEEIEEEK